jgi:hypothetical protein
MIHVSTIHVSTIIYYSCLLFMILLPHNVFQSDCYDCKEGWRCKDGEGTPVEEIERQKGWDANSHYINLCTDDQPECVQEVKE